MRRRLYLVALALFSASCQQPTLEDAMQGEWYMRVPPAFKSTEQLRFAIKGGVIANRRDGIAWGTYEILDQRTIRLTLPHRTTRQPVHQLLTVEVMPDGSFSCYPPDTNREPIFIFTRENDGTIAHR